MISNDFKMTELIGSRSLWNRKCLLMVLRSSQKGQGQPNINQEMSPNDSEIHVIGKRSRSPKPLIGRS